MKICKRCKIEKPRESFYKMKGKAYKDSWDCRASVCIECQKIITKEKRNAVKQRAIEYLGGRCVDCGLETLQYAVYDFHHVDPSKKEIAFGSTRKSFAAIKPELDKCVLLCANCHRIRHYC